MARELNKLLIADEVGLHVMERSFMTMWIERRAREAPLRAGRRMSYIEPIVESLKDVSVDEALDATAWATRALLEQAVAEASPERRKRGIPTKR